MRVMLAANSGDRFRLQPWELVELRLELARLQLMAATGSANERDLASIELDSYAALLECVLANGQGAELGLGAQWQ